MARNHYSYQKRKKEIAKQKKKERKQQRKLDRKNMQLKESEAPIPNEISEQSSDENAALM